MIGYSSSIVITKLVVIAGFASPSVRFLRQAFTVDIKDHTIGKHHPRTITLGLIQISSLLHS